MRDVSKQGTPTKETRIICVYPFCLLLICLTTGTQNPKKTEESCVYPCCPTTGTNPGTQQTTHSHRTSARRVVGAARRMTPACFGSPGSPPWWACRPPRTARTPRASAKKNTEGWWKRMEKESTSRKVEVLVLAKKGKKHDAS